MFLRSLLLFLSTVFFLSPCFAKSRAQTISALQLKNSGQRIYQCDYGRSRRTPRRLEIRQVLEKKKESQSLSPTAENVVTESDEKQKVKYYTVDFTYWAGADRLVLYRYKVAGKTMIDGQPALLSRMVSAPGHGPDSSSLLIVRTHNLKKGKENTSFNFNKTISLDGTNLEERYPEGRSLVGQCHNLAKLIESLKVPTVAVSDMDQVQSQSYNSKFNRSVFDQLVANSNERMEKIAKRK